MVTEYIQTIISSNWIEIKFQLYTSAHTHHMHHESYDILPRRVVHSSIAMSIRMVYCRIPIWWHQSTAFHKVHGIVSQHNTAPSVFATLRHATKPFQSRKNDKIFAFEWNTRGATGRWFGTNWEETIYVFTRSVKYVLFICTKSFGSIMNGFTNSINIVWWWSTVHIRWPEI